MEELYTKIGKLIKQKRKQCKLTQEALANDIDTATQYISKIERGKVHASLEMLYKIANALNTPIYSILPAANLNNRKYLSEEINYRIDNCSDAQKMFISNFIVWYLSQPGNES